MRKPWRPDLYVVARFLEKLDQNGPVTKGKLQPAVRLNYDLFLRYLEELHRRGLLRRDGEGRNETVQLTAAGRDLKRRMEDWIRQVFQGRL